MWPGWSKIKAAAHEDDALAVAFPFLALENQIVLRDDLPQFPAPSTAAFANSTKLNSIMRARAARGDVRMKRWQIDPCASPESVLLLLGASFVRRSSLPRRDALIVAGSCHTPATILEPPAGREPVGTAILLHGLGANRRTMMYLGTDFRGTWLSRLPARSCPGTATTRMPSPSRRRKNARTPRVESLMREGQDRSDENNSAGTFDGRSDRDSHGGPRPRGGNDCDFARADGAAAAHAREFAGLQRAISICGR